MNKLFTQTNIGSVLVVTSQTPIRTEPIFVYVENLFKLIFLSMNISCMHNNMCYLNKRMHYIRQKMY